MVDSVAKSALINHHSGRLPAGRCTLEVHHGGAWHRAAEVRCDDTQAGIRSRTRLDYDLDYLDALDHAVVRDARAVSCLYATNFEEHDLPTWPPFLLDVIPSGAARRFWERELRLPNREDSDWAVLVAGGGNAPGNVRVAEAADRAPPVDHPGFERAEVLERADDFIEYARSRGASIAGGSGAAGDAPKFLLREDVEGRWHADGALDDTRTARSWLLKFPRSPRAADRLVLEAEAPFARVAARLGVRVASPLAWADDCLFVPRFDRPQNPTGAIRRLGMESLCSLAGVAEFGASIPKEALAAAVAVHTTDPVTELRELLLRDVVDVALGNTDNHARNTAVLKDVDAPVALTPLYDFAPMVLDPQGIARVCRWRAEEDGYPVWGAVADVLAPHGLESTATKTWLRDLGPLVGALPRIMAEEEVPRRVIEVLTERTARVARALEQTR